MREYPVRVEYYNGIKYYIHYIRDFWKSFGRYYPEIRSAGFGISVSKAELEQAIQTPGAVIIVMMPVDPYNESKGKRTYGLPAREWYDFCQENHTWNFHTSSSLENGSIPARMLKNMEGFNKINGKNSY